MYFIPAFGLLITWLHDTTGVVWLNLHPLCSVLSRGEIKGTETTKIWDNLFNGAFKHLTGIKQWNIIHMEYQNTILKQQQYNAHDQVVFITGLN